MAKQTWITLIMLVSSLITLAQSKMVTTKTTSGKSVNFVLHLPKDYKVSQTYPVVIGPSELEDTDGSYYWRDFKSNKSWIVIDAEIYKGVNHIESLKAIQKYLQANHSIEGGKFHAVCFSANSSPIFKLVIAAPDLFHSITGMPASCSASETEFKKLKEVKIQLLVGANDGYWLRSSQSLHKKFQNLGLDSRIEVFPNVGHFLILLRGQPLIDRIEQLRPKA